MSAPERGALDPIARFDRPAWMKQSAATQAASSANSARDPALTSGRHLFCKPSHSCEYAAHPATTPTKMVADPRTYRTEVEARDFHPSPANPTTNAPTDAPTVMFRGTRSKFDPTMSPMNAPGTAPKSARPPALAPIAMKASPPIRQLIIQMFAMDSSRMNARVLSIRAT